MKARDLFSVWVEDKKNISQTMSILGTFVREPIQVYGYIEHKFGYNRYKDEWFYKRILQYLEIAIRLKTDPKNQCNAVWVEPKEGYCQIHFLYMYEENE